LQLVHGPAGQRCGAILWESKRTKTWSSAWLAKLRSDQRTAKAELAVIVSVTLPKEVETFDLVEGIWVTSWRTLIPLAHALRCQLVEVAHANQRQVGKQTKMELVYDYLTGSQFRARIQAIMEKYRDMQNDLVKEREAMNRFWAKREKQILCVLESATGMYGDLQGIAGQSLPQIEGLSGDETDVPPAVAPRLTAAESRRKTTDSCEPSTF
jgi:hypothetical protein